MPWEVLSDKVRDIKRKSLAQNLSFGGEVSFEVDKVGTLLEDIKVDVTLSAITPLGVGTYARFVDGIGLALFPTITMSHGSNTLQILPNQAEYIKLLRDSTLKDADVYRRQVVIGETPAQRNTNAAAAQVVRAYIKPWFWKLAGHSIIISSLANKLKTTLNFANLQDVIQTDYSLGATATISKVEFVYDVINVTGEERNQFTALTMQSEGITYLGEEMHVPKKSFKIPAGETSYPLKIEGLLLPFSSVYFYIQKNSDVITPFYKKPFELALADFNLITLAELKEGESATIDIAYGAKDFADKWTKKHCGAPWAHPIGFFSLSEIADLKNANLGSLNSSNINDLTLNLTFTGALAVDMAVTVVFVEHNFWNHQGGELMRILNA